MTQEIMVCENFESARNYALCELALKALNKAYPHYTWAARAVDVECIMIMLGQLLDVLGDDQGMLIHPRDWSCIPEFEKMVIKFGGEMLESADLSRTKNTGKIVTKTPDGFDPSFNMFLRVKKYKLKPNDERFVKDSIWQNRDQIRAQGGSI